jgi:uncharacterized membrane protein YbhN (UPF0104 family)
VVDNFLTPISGALGLLSLFGGIGLLMWIDHRSKIREKEHAHAERMKALEVGQPLPDADVARSGADASRAWAAALTAILVSLGMAGAAVGATALVFRMGDAHVHLPLVCVVWGVCGLVSLITVTGGLDAMRRRGRGEERGRRSPGNGTAPQSMEAIRAADGPVNTMG